VGGLDLPWPEPTPAGLRRAALLLGETLVYGPLYGVLRYLIRNPHPHDPERLWTGIQRQLPPFFDWARDAYPPHPLRRMLLHRWLRQERAGGIGAHYDVTLDFFRIFLDRRYLFYSAADFQGGAASIEEAQDRKVAFLLQLIAPREGDAILDLGCGFGGMMERILEASAGEARVRGMTLSRVQAEHALGRGLDVEFRDFVTAEYPPAHYDRVYSIGSWEHVRRDDVDDLLARLHRTLKADGRLVMQFFCPIDDSTPSWLLSAQIFFPGSATPGYAWQIQAFERAGFRIRHVSIHDYRPTLRAWFDRLAAEREKAIQLADLETYNRFLVFFAVSFRLFEEGRTILGRYVLEKAEK